VSTAIENRSSTRRRVASARISLRIHPQVKARLMQAARIQQIQLSEFMIRASQSSAETALAERTRFVLSPRKWREFNAALDAPPRRISALGRLFDEPSVLNEA